MSLKSWEIGLADLSDVPMTPEREHTLKIMMFSYIKDSGEDPKKTLTPEELVEYYKWVKEDK